MSMDWTTGWSRYDPRQRRKDFSSRLCAQTGSEAHPASYLMGTGGPFTGVKRGRGVTLTTHPIWCRGQEHVGAILPLPPQAPTWRVAGLLYPTLTEWSPDIKRTSSGKKRMSSHTTQFEMQSRNEGIWKLHVYCKLDILSHSRLHALDQSKVQVRERSHLKIHFYF
jgi:hypothetical protein